ncbi:hypothetical protein HT136_20045 [Novosphingobium profundi]|nr:hypothetical protein [Novosphingobium profundi]
MLIASSVVALVASVPATHAQTPAAPQVSTCDRACMSGIVDTLLQSMVAHDPDHLPLTAMYEATENSRPAALGMMQAWRTITQAQKPSLLAIDTHAGQAYFALNVSEGGNTSILWGRIKVIDRKISQLEIFLNRSRADHGFSFSPEQLPENYRFVMHPPAGRKKATHAQLVALSNAAFDASDPLKVDVAKDCQFTELGWKVIDPGLDDQPPRPNAEEPLGCMFPPFRPTDKQARTIVIDDELGIVVDAAVIRGMVYPYPWHGRMISAFIPVDMAEPAKMQDDWIKRHMGEHKAPIVKPMPATGEVMQVLQYYDGKLQASQINVYLGSKGALSDWVAPDVTP